MDHLKYDHLYVCDVVGVVRPGPCREEDFDEIVLAVRAQRPDWQFRGAQSMSARGFTGDRGKFRTTISILFAR